MKYKAEGVPSVVFGGDEYGQGSSRDWAAKGPQLLGTKAVIVRNFERIHRANLVFMGVLPLQFKDGESASSLKLRGTESYDIAVANLKPRATIAVRVQPATGAAFELEAVVRIDTPEELTAFRHGGILPYVLRQLVQN